MSRLDEALISLEKSPVFMENYRRFMTVYPSVKKFWLWLWIALVAFDVVGTFIYFIEPRTYVEVWIETGKRFGDTAALFYVVTLIPGILKRFDILPLTRATLKLPRRQIGVTVFILAFTHEWLVRFVPVTLETGIFLPENLHILMGMTSLTLLFPLWLTSNDFSKQRLGKWWKTLHALTYIAMFTILFHVALAGQLWIALVVLVAIFAEIASWIHSRARKR